GIIFHRIFGRLARPKIFGRVVLLCLLSPTRYSPYDEQVCFEVANLSQTIPGPCIRGKVMSSPRAVPPEGNTSPRTRLSRRHNSGLNESIKRRGFSYRVPST
ncbi:hypothetical protein U9M48_037094, partial [Paspalum notatum var. saurae]